MGWACRANPNSDCDPWRNKLEKGVEIMGSFLRGLKRFGRSLLSLLITGAVAIATKEPSWLIFAPVIQATAKFLRDKFGLKYIPL